MEDNKSMEVFAKAPIRKAVLQNALPAMAAMLMVLIYNLADTFFIGQTHDDLQVAAVSLATPVFLLFMSVGTVFGIGGTSVISRALGEGRRDYAKTYLVIVGCSGPFVLIANCYSNIIRAEGQSGKAMMGQVIGNLLNVILDPIMMFGWDIAGAAIATVIGNVVGTGYYIIYFLKGLSSLSISLKDFSVKEKVASGVLAIGVPAALGNLLMSLSSIIMNSQMAKYGDMAVAGMKITMMTGMVCIGLGQGVQPLLGYCVGAKNWERYRSALKFSLIFAFSLSTVLTALLPLYQADRQRIPHGCGGV